MQSALDQAITAVSAAEATVIADQNSVTTIQTAIATATAPLDSAQKTLAADTAAFNQKLDDLVTAAQAAKIPVAPAPPTPTA